MFSLSSELFPGENFLLWPIADGDVSRLFTVLVHQIFGRFMTFLKVQNSVTSLSSFQVYTPS